ncbi:MAG: DnaJ domain-containing protein, partial [Candidatus Omnitrophota bacterium]
MNIKLQPTENRIEQPKEFKSNFKAWVRMVAFIVVAVFLPEQVAQAVEYDWRVIWNKPSVGSIAPAYLKNLANVDTALAIRNILKDIANKPINSIKVSSNLTINLDKPLRMSNQRIDEITEWLKGKPCGTKALYDYLNYTGVQASDGDIAIVALTSDILNDVVKPEGNPKVIKNSLYALFQAAKFFGSVLYPVKIKQNTELNELTPFIAHLNFDHFILVIRVTKDKVYYSDEHKEEFMPKAKFLSEFSGYALINILPADLQILDINESKKILGAKKKPYDPAAIYAKYSPYAAAQQGISSSMSLADLRASLDAQTASFDRMGTGAATIAAGGAIVAPLLFVSAPASVAGVITFSLANGAGWTAIENGAHYMNTGSYLPWQDSLGVFAFNSATFGVGSWLKAGKLAFTGTSLTTFAKISNFVLPRIGSGILMGNLNLNLSQSINQYMTGSFIKDPGTIAFTYGTGFVSGFAIPGTVGNMPGANSLFSTTGRLFAGAGITGLVTTGSYNAINYFKTGSLLSPVDSLTVFGLSAGTYFLGGKLSSLGATTTSPFLSSALQVTGRGLLTAGAFETFGQGISLGTQGKFITDFNTNAFIVGGGFATGAFSKLASISNLNTGLSGSLLKIGAGSLATGSGVTTGLNLINYGKTGNLLSPTESLTVFAISAGTYGLSKGLSSWGANTGNSLLLRASNGVAGAGVFEAIGQGYNLGFSKNGGFNKDLWENTLMIGGGFIGGSLSSKALLNNIGSKIITQAPLWGETYLLSNMGMQVFNRKYLIDQLSSTQSFLELSKLRDSKDLTADQRVELDKQISSLNSDQLAMLDKGTDLLASEVEDLTQKTKQGLVLSEMIGAYTEGVKSGVMFSVIFGGLSGIAASTEVGGILGNTSKLGAAMRAHPLITSVLAGSVAFPAAKTIISGDLSLSNFKLNYSDPWNYARGAVIGLGVGWGFTKSTTGWQGFGSRGILADGGSFLGKFGYGAVVGVTAGTGVDLAKDSLSSLYWNYNKAPLTDDSSIFAKYFFSRYAFLDDSQKSDLPAEFISGGHVFDPAKAEASKYGLSSVLNYGVGAAGYALLGGFTSIYASNHASTFIEKLKGFAAPSQGTSALYNLSREGAVSWMAVSPAFTVATSAWGSAWNGIIGSANKNLGLETPLKPLAESLDNLTWGKVIQSAITGPTSGLWMKPMLGLLQSTTPKASVASTGGLVEKTWNSFKWGGKFFENLFGGQGVKASAAAASSSIASSIESGMVKAATNLAAKNVSSLFMQAARSIDSMLFMSSFVTGVDTAISVTDQLAVISLGTQAQKDALAAWDPTSQLPMPGYMSKEIKQYAKWLPFLMVPSFQPKRETSLDIYQGKQGLDGAKSRMDALDVLGLKSGATEAEIKAAYRQQTKIFHPDVNNSPLAPARFMEISNAYSFLTNKSTSFSRTVYNTTAAPSENTAPVSNPSTGETSLAVYDPIFARTQAELAAGQIPSIWRLQTNVIPVITNSAPVQSVIELPASLPSVQPTSTALAVIPTSASTSLAVYDPIFARTQAELAAGQMPSVWQSRLQLDAIALSEEVSGAGSDNVVKSLQQPAGTLPIINEGLPIPTSRSMAGGGLTRIDVAIKEAEKLLGQARREPDFAARPEQTSTTTDIINNAISGQDMMYTQRTSGGKTQVIIPMIEKTTEVLGGKVIRVVPTDTGLNTLRTNPVMQELFPGRLIISEEDVNTGLNQDPVKFIASIENAKQIAISQSTLNSIENQASLGNVNSQKALSALRQENYKGLKIMIHDEAQYATPPNIIGEAPLPVIKSHPEIVKVGVEVGNVIFSKLGLSEKDFGSTITDQTGNVHKANDFGVTRFSDSAMDKIAKELIGPQATAENLSQVQLHAIQAAAIEMPKKRGTDDNYVVGQGIIEMSSGEDRSNTNTSDPYAAVMRQQKYKHKYGIEVSDDLVVTSPRGNQVGYSRVLNNFRGAGWSIPGLTATPQARKAAWEYGIAMDIQAAVDSSSRDFEALGINGSQIRVIADVKEISLSDLSGQGHVRIATDAGVSDYDQLIDRGLTLSREGNFKYLVAQEPGGNWVRYENGRIELNDAGEIRRFSEQDMNSILLDPATPKTLIIHSPEGRANTDVARSGVGSENIPTLGIIGPKTTTYDASQLLGRGNSKAAREVIVIDSTNSFDTDNIAETLRANTEQKLARDAVSEIVSLVSETTVNNLETLEIRAKQDGDQKLADYLRERRYDWQTTQKGLATPDMGSLQDVDNYILDSFNRANQFMLQVCEAIPVKGRSVQMQNIINVSARQKPFEKLVYKGEANVDPASARSKGLGGLNNLGELFNNMKYHVNRGDLGEWVYPGYNADKAEAKVTTSTQIGGLVLPRSPSQLLERYFPDANTGEREALLSFVQDPNNGFVWKGNLQALTPSGRQLGPVLTNKNLLGISASDKSALETLGIYIPESKNSALTVNQAIDIVRQLHNAGLSLAQALPVALEAGNLNLGLSKLDPVAPQLTLEDLANNPNLGVVKPIVEAINKINVSVNALEAAKKAAEKAASVKKEQTLFKVGDLVNFEVNGVLQTGKPVPIKNIEVYEKTGEKFYFFEGSTTGIPESSVKSIEVASQVTPKESVVNAERDLAKAQQNLGIIISNTGLTPAEVLLNKVTGKNTKLDKQLRAMYGPLVDSLKAVRAGAGQSSIKYKLSMKRLFDSLSSTPISQFNRLPNINSEVLYNLSVPFGLSLSTPGQIEAFKKLLEEELSKNKSKKSGETTIQSLAKMAVYLDEKFSIIDAESKEADLAGAAAVEQMKPAEVAPIVTETLPVKDNAEALKAGRSAQQVVDNAASINQELEALRSQKRDLEREQSKPSTLRRNKNNPLIVLNIRSGISKLANEIRLKEARLLELKKESEQPAGTVPIVSETLPIETKEVVIDEIRGLELVKEVSSEEPAVLRYEDFAKPKVSSQDEYSRDVQEVNKLYTAEGEMRATIKAEPDKDQKKVLAKKLHSIRNKILKIGIRYAPLQPGDVFYIQNDTDQYFSSDNEPWRFKVVSIGWTGRFGSESFVKYDYTLEYVDGPFAGQEVQPAATGEIFNKFNILARDKTANEESVAGIVESQKADLVVPIDAEIAAAKADMDAKEKILNDLKAAIALSTESNAQEQANVTNGEPEYIASPETLLKEVSVIKDTKSKPDNTTSSATEDQVVDVEVIESEQSSSETNVKTGNSEFSDIVISLVGRIFGGDFQDSKKKMVKIVEAVEGALVGIELKGSQDYISNVIYNALKDMNKRWGERWTASTSEEVKFEDLITLIKNDLSYDIVRAESISKAKPEIGAENKTGPPAKTLSLSQRIKSKLTSFVIGLLLVFTLVSFLTPLLGSVAQTSTPAQTTSITATATLPTDNDNSAIVPVADNNNVKADVNLIAIVNTKRDDSGRPVKITYSNGAYNIYTYDDANYTGTIVRYDSNGKVLDTGKADYMPVLIKSTESTLTTAEKTELQTKMSSGTYKAGDTFTLSSGRLVRIVEEALTTAEKTELQTKMSSGTYKAGDTFTLSSGR